MTNEPASSEALQRSQTKLLSQAEQLYQAQLREGAAREVLQLITQSRRDYTPVFEAIAVYSANLCRAPMVRVVLLNATGTHFRTVSAAGNNQQSFGIGIDISMASSHIVASTIRVAGTHQFEDMRDTILYREGDPVRRRLVDKDGVRSCLAVPLVLDGVGIGCIVLSRCEVDPFDGEEIDLIETFAEQAVIAIENTRQFEALENLTAKDVNAAPQRDRLCSFLSPSVADAVMAAGDDVLLGSRRALIAILFCDIRGFSVFSEDAQPEETIEFLQACHDSLGKLIQQAEAGFDHWAGDGVMVIFNAPVACDDPAGAALRLAFEMRSVMQDLCAKWQTRGHQLGFGIGISLGHATVGMVGFGGRDIYTASGAAVKLATCLCDLAVDGEILLDPRAASATRDIAAQNQAGKVTPKGALEPVAVSRAIGLKVPA